MNQDVVKDFGRESQRFDQSLLSADELHSLFKTCFAVPQWGARLERRLTKEQIEDMMRAAGLVDNAPPYWCVVGFKALPRKWSDRGSASSKL